MEQGKIHIGTSGFSYKDWLGNFYPQFCPPADFLKLYNSQFKTVEIDATFYRIPTKETVQKWHKTVCADFIFTAKFPRTVTHEGTLAERISNVGHFCETMRHLDEKLGPLLMQFPYSFKPDKYDLLCSLVGSLPDDLRISVEIRNKAWLEEPKLFSLLESRNIAICMVDHPWMPKFDKATAPFSYVRLLGDHKKITEDFSYIRDDRREDLDYWKEVVKSHSSKGQEVFIYFNNHFSGHAPSTAYELIESLAL